MSIYINNIFLIDLNNISEENSNNLENIQEIFNNFTIISYSKISDLFEEIKKEIYKYKLINIIIIDELYDEFINKLDEELSNIFYIPIIYVLSSDLENFNELIKNSNFNDFYLIGGVHDSYESIYNKIQEFDNLLNKKEFQFEEKKIFDLNQKFIFQTINNKYDLILLFLFKFIINSENISKDEFELLIDYLYNNFSKEKVFDLFKPSLIIKSIPFQILNKWWLRAFSLNSKLNNNLKLKEEFFNTFIKILYKSFDINSIDFYNEEFNLYRTQIMNENEYKKILNDFNNKKENLIVFSNNFVNFFKSIEIVNSIRLESNENQISILFELKNFKNKNFFKGIDLQNYSFYPNEKEIIFLPFSSFCVENVEDDEIGKKISLIYIDNYFNEDIQKILKNKENLSEIISQSNEQIFVKNIIESKIINNVENFEDFEKIINEKIENDFDNNVNENDYVQTNFYQINKNEFDEILYLNLNNLNNESEEERSSENEKENQINSYEKDENEKENKLILNKKENNLDKNLEQNLIKFSEPIIYYNIEYKKFLDKKLNSITFNIKFKNIGNNIWNEKYSLKLKNISLFNLQSFNLEKKIKPNEEFNAKIIINLNKSEIKINKTYILKIYLYDENNKEIQNDKQIINITVNKFISLTKDDYSTLYMKLINTNHSNMKDVTLEKIENDINNELNNIKIISYSQKNKILSNLFNKLSKKYKGIKK